MRLTKEDLPKLRAALLACKLSGLDKVVISQGKVRGLGEKKNAAVLSTLELSISPEISMGIDRLSELDKRLALFGEDVAIEGEVNEANKVRKLSIKAIGKAGKIEFRCTDEKLITYPKSNSDEPGIVVTLTRPEVALIAKGAKTLGVERLTLQVKRDGTVHIECADSNMDRFEADLEAKAEFIDESYPVVNSFDVTSGGVFLPILEHMVKDSDTATLVVMKTGNVGMKAYGHDVLAIPRIQVGD